MILLPLVAVVTFGALAKNAKHIGRLWRHWKNSHKVLTRMITKQRKNKTVHLK